MLRAAVIWRVPVLRMSDVSCPGPTEFGRISQFGRFGRRFQQETATNSASRIGREVWLPCPARAMPIVHPVPYRRVCTSRHTANQDPAAFANGRSRVPPASVRRKKNQPLHSRDIRPSNARCIRKFLTARIRRDYSRRQNYPGHFCQDISGYPKWGLC
jgi:hypothetical protein